MAAGHAPALAQVATGSITGTVEDVSGAVLPGVTVTLTGERLIGGAQSQTTDTSGAYRFARLPPGAYVVKFELQGFKGVERRDIVVNASFTATVNVKLEVGTLQETITVSGESPTVDVKSNLQQTVMSQEILEGIPTGRDPWSLAKVIPGVQVSTYDVGGNQAMQQSSLRVHGARDEDKNFSIDGTTVNWPGGGGGSTMLYYDQGMFDEVNYQTSAIPAEVMTGGIYLNMVTKSGSNRWRGDLKYFFADKDWQSVNDQELKNLGLPGGTPVTKLYDFNVAGGGPLARDRLWVNGSYRNWRTDKLTLARNPDGSRAIDDNLIWNISGKAIWQMTANQKVSGSYNYNWKERFHRRDTPPNFVEDQASLWQTNPAFSAQAKYTLVRGKIVFDSTFGIMDGVTNYYYQPGTADTDIRVVDNGLSTAAVAADRHEEAPNYRTQFDNVVSYATPAWGGDHLLKAGMQFAQMGMYQQFWTNGDMHIEFNNSAPNQVRLFNTPTAHNSKIQLYGLFAQDAWSYGRATLNIGIRVDHASGWMPEQAKQAGTFSDARTLERTDVFSSWRGVWRTGVVYDVFGTGRTAIKASASRYAGQIGLNMVQRVHPFQRTSGTRPWTDRDGDRVPQDSELGAFTGFPGLTSRYADEDGPAWSYSDEFTAGVEHQLMENFRVGVMYYRRTNRDQIGQRNVAAPRSAYTEHTVTVPGAPNGPGGSITFYNLNPTFTGRQDNVFDNEPLLDTTYNGVEITASKRFTQRWQLVAGLTLGRNYGGVVGTPTTMDLNDPNNELNFPEGIEGPDSDPARELIKLVRTFNWERMGAARTRGTAVALRKERLIPRPQAPGPRPHAPRLGDVRRFSRCENGGMKTTELALISESLADVAAAAAPAVVQVQGHRRPASGVVYDADTVLTNARTVGREDGLRVVTHDGRAIDAELAGWDPATGLAVLRAKGLDLRPAERADTPPKVGHLALAIGRSWSNALTVSAGIVSVIGGPLRTGRGRSIEQVIRTTAPVHDGFAGGAFVSVTGGVLGITTRAEIRGTTVVIPAAIAWKTAADVLRHGSPRRGFLGVAAQPVSLIERQRGDPGRERALLITGVTSGAPADAAGLLVGDVLLGFDGHPLESPEELLDLLTGDRIGRPSTLRVLRAGLTQDVTVTVGTRDAS
jgi:S1-C subfamily serine protease